MQTQHGPRLRRCLAVVAAALAPGVAGAQAGQAVDYLSFAQGAFPVRVGGAAAKLKVDIEHALQAVDGDAAGFVVTRRPGAADTEVWFVYRLPAATVFTAFAVPRVLETPSPAQTFFREIEIAGGDQGPDGPFQRLAGSTLSVHPDKNRFTRFPATRDKSVTWVKVTLRGGIDVQRDKTFFEFSEIIGEGRQERVPMVDAFTGQWKGRGVLVGLKQNGAIVSGCYDRAGDLRGTVSGNLLHATGTDRGSGVRSTFVVTVDAGKLFGVRSTNGAPFSLYAGAPAPGVLTQCSEKPVRAPGCGDTVHGIRFDYDSAVIRPESAPVIDALFKGLKDATSSAITIAGHTSSEGSEAYNRELSQRRAAAVVAALVARGIDAKRLSAQGLGEARPIADNSGEAGRSLNRRVEIACR